MLGLSRPIRVKDRDGKYENVEMSKHTRNDKIRNDYMWKKVGVAHMEEKMIEARIWWFEHV